jgi:hypothetical protein
MGHKAMSMTHTGEAREACEGHSFSRSFQVFLALLTRPIGTLFLSGVLYLPRSMTFLVQ